VGFFGERVLAALKYSKPKDKDLTAFSEVGFSHNTLLQPSSS